MINNSRKFKMTTAYNSDATEAVVGSSVGNPRTRHPFSEQQVTELTINTRHGFHLRGEANLESLTKEVIGSRKMQDFF
jgi:hypothetical protein